MTHMDTTNHASSHVILPLPGNDAFAQRLASEGGWPLGNLETRNFPTAKAISASCAT